MTIMRFSEFRLSQVAVSLLVACLAAAPLGAQEPASAPRSPAEQSRLDGGIPPFTAEDVAFMQGMIGHHGQAVLMATWAADHGARPDIQRLAERIRVAQQDEIAFMQTWLRDRKQALPDSASPHAMHAMHDGTTSEAGAATLMPGMLTDTQLAALDAARNQAFDELFLLSMIRHHEGAVSMVEQLFGAHGAAHDDDIQKFANDVAVDQTTEVDRMLQLLESVRAARRQ